MKIRPVGYQLFHADGQTDRHDAANGRFSQFCEKRLKKREDDELIEEVGPSSDAEFLANCYDTFGKTIRELFVPKLYVSCLF